MTAVLLLIGGALAGVIVDRLWDRAERHLTTVRPAGRLWGWLASDGPVQIVMSKGLVHSEEYTDLVFPTEAQAAAEIRSHLGAVLRKEVSQKLSDGLGEDLTDDLVLIGGPVANDVSRRVLALPEVPFRFDGHTIVHEETGERWRATVTLRDGRGSVSTDYCLIVRTRNPFNAGRGLLLIGGSRAYGTLAGARIMLADNAAETFQAVERLGDHYMAMVVASVHNGVPGEPRIIRCWTLDDALEGEVDRYVA